MHEQLIWLTNNLFFAYYDNRKEALFLVKPIARREPEREAEGSEQKNSNAKLTNGAIAPPSAVIPQ